ncbi:MAG TPA: YlxR family protein [Dehalococcoidia bacterium]|nr:YlxR family protein [Dehalococcoidia bacterium]
MKSKSKAQSPRQRHIPERSCVACRGKRPKRALVRLVCSGGAVKVDLNGRKVGRGAYLCPLRECWESGLKGNRLEHALRIKLSAEDRQVLLEFGRSLPNREGCQS